MDELVIDEVTRVGKRGGEAIAWGCSEVRSQILCWRSRGERSHDLGLR